MGLVVCKERQAVVSGYGGYSPERVRSFLYDTNTAIGAIRKLHRTEWGRQQLLRVDPSGVLLSGECSVAYAALIFMRFAMHAAPQSYGNGVGRGRRSRIRVSIVKKAVKS